MKCRRGSSFFCGALMVMMATLGCANASAQAPATEDWRQGLVTPRIQPLNANPTFDYFDGLTLDESIPTPRQFLGYDIGERFTRHSDVMRYLDAVAVKSDRVIMGRYGATYEGRSLQYLVISSPANLSRLDDIKAKNRELAEPRATMESAAQQIIANNPAIVWFSFNVHGNEASSSEAAMQLVYTLAAAQDDEVRAILDQVVLVVDPMVNPDGRDRYVNWYNMVVSAGQGPNASPDAAEHDEPWPGGRTNHYYFDLNRDWLWLVHPASRQRLTLYRTFLPQLHVDFHEQEYRSPYFFGAGDEPYNVNIPAETREWIELYGEANARTFDERGLVYATKERFDYLYPGYGKVLPVYHGAVGLLCEQAGHGFAGLAVDVEEAYTLTLRSRAYHHFLLAMNYLETTAQHRQGQLERFRRFFTDSVQLQDEGAKAFFIDPQNDPALLKKLWDLCSAHGIRIDVLGEDLAVPGLQSYRQDVPAPTTMKRGAWVIETDQAMGRLARAVLERDTKVSDIDTYDITAWSLPVSWGLDASFTNTALDANAPLTRLTNWAATPARVTGTGSVALIVDSRQHRFPAAVGAGIKQELFMRRTGGSITTGDGATFGAGSLIVHMVRNRPERVQAFVEACLANGVNVHRVGTGMVTDGRVLGANDNGLFTNPKALLVRDEPMSAASYGSIWHLMDVEMPLPHTSVNADRLTRIDLDAYNLIILPELGGRMSDEVKEALATWTRAGGTIVAVGSSAQWASEHLLELDQDEEDDEETKLHQLSFEEREQRSVEERVPGALLAARVDTTHPLAAGLKDWIGVLKRGSRTLPVAEDGYVVARFADVEQRQALRIGGTISAKNEMAISGEPFVTHHRLGRGAVICFSDDLTFRGFHHAGMRMLMNAIVYGPSL